MTYRRPGPPRKKTKLVSATEQSFKELKAAAKRMEKDMKEIKKTVKAIARKVETKKRKPSVKRESSGNTGRKRMDLTGQAIGSLTCLNQGPDRETSGGRIRTTWDCICVCGNYTNVMTTNLMNNNTKSCGCLRGRQEAITTYHGHTAGKGKSPTYSVWNCIKTRCYCESHDSWKNYGGKGIKMCEQWKKSFECFLFDMGERPEGCQIHRLDSSKDYEPSNCIWLHEDEHVRLHHEKM